jgi:hypothetical protein
VSFEIQEKVLKKIGDSGVDEEENVYGRATIVSQVNLGRD